MAHELARTANGTAAMFSVRETPWHREGHILTEAPDFATGLELAGHGDRALRDEWLRILERHEPEIQAALDANEPDKAKRLHRAVERSARAQWRLAALEQSIETLAAQLAAQRPQGGRPGVTQLLALVFGGRDPTTLRAWRSGKQLIPERAAHFLERIENLEIVELPDGELRLRLEVKLDA